MIYLESADKSALARVNLRLNQYLAITKKTEDEVLNKKGNDLRIQAYKLFRERKWNGGKGIAERELRKRTKAGKGTKVRDMVLSGKYGSSPVDKNGRKLSKWQQLVRQETLKRQSGIGVLGVTFLQKRWKYGKGSEPKYLVKNVSRMLGTLVEIKKEKGSFSITGFTPGIDKVSTRYSIQFKALNAVSQDMEAYMIPRLNRDLSTIGK